MPSYLNADDTLESRGESDHVVVELADRASGGQSRRFPCKSTLRLIHRPAQTLTTNPPTVPLSVKTTITTSTVTKKHHRKWERFTALCKDYRIVESRVLAAVLGRCIEKISDNFSPNSARAGKVKSQTPKVEAQGAYSSTFGIDLVWKLNANDIFDAEKKKLPYV